MDVNKVKRQSWNVLYALDIPAIDKQHMQFFRIFDKFNALNHINLDFDVIKNYIDELEKYTRTHFQTEESLLRMAKFEEFDFHVEQHQIFIKKINEFKIAYGYGNHLLLEQIITFMRKWLIVHISEVDRKYVDSVKKMLAEKKFTTDYISDNYQEEIDKE